jgi:hypothetical protein
MGGLGGGPPLPAIPLPFLPVPALLPPVAHGGPQAPPGLGGPIAFPAIPLPVHAVPALLPPLGGGVGPLAPMGGPGAPHAVPAIPLGGPPQGPPQGPPLAHAVPALLPAPVAPVAPVLPALPAVPPVRFRIGENGKIHYFKRDDVATQQAQAASYIEMSAQDFSVFKGAGKRYGSHKITDPETMRSYVRDAATGTFYEFDKAAADERGAVAGDQAGLTGKYNTNRLMDRSRNNRIGGALQPFDVGHYKQAAPGSNMDALSGKAENFGANRDHVVSGESLKRRARAHGADANAAYNQGLTIAIPNNEMHKPHSPTFGGRQASKDTVGGAEAARAAQDAAHPAVAFHRDVTTMLARTRGQNHGGVHPGLDLTNADNRVKQIGAYRKLFKASAKMHAADPNRGFNPAAPAYDVVHTPKHNEPQKIGTFTSVLSPGGGSQGKKLAGSLSQSLRDTGRARP